jgi:large subunit ribosomal protein L25
MKTIEINGNPREGLGKKESNLVRKSELVPCVLYGGGENVHFTLHVNDVKKMIYTPEIYLVNLTIAGKLYVSLIKDVQYHPVTDKVLHIDFYQTTEGKKIDIKIPVKLEGLSEGVKAGGKLSLQMRRLKVRGEVKDIPDSLVVDVTTLGLGKTIKVGALNFNNLEILDAKNSVVAMVKLTRGSRGATE